MILAVPAETLVTTPVPATTVATPGVPELHVPPPVASARVVVLPKHMVSVPVIGVVGFTVIVVLPVAVFPHASVIVKLYVVVAPGVTVAGEPRTGPGVQLNVYGGTPYVPDAVRVEVAPAQIVVGLAVAETNSTV